MSKFPIGCLSIVVAVAAVVSAAIIGPGIAAADDAAETAKTVLITGANRGLGLEFARQYAAAGWQVIGTARTPATATELNDLGVRVLQLDVVDGLSVAQLAEDVADQPIDLLINNAGIMDRDADSIEGLKFDSVERVLAVNTIGPMRVTQALLGNLRSGAGKQIVHITSGLGSIADNTRGGFYGYRESKAALNMFNRSLAAELRSEGFTCVVMSPGWVQTDMGGAAATLTPEQSIAGMRKVIAGLSPDDTGSFLSWDGIRVAW
jgi:NAD(P)-dependent dehydrogenase (short-subunit alcohol dehydrogenase family)